ncbi:MAG: hypothetical protein LCH41_04775 [Armatimonadetes bacterium]|nr:hypothetical protein [Armatimonadota bacterium]
MMKLTNGRAGILAAMVAGGVLLSQSPSATAQSQRAPADDENSFVSRALDFGILNISSWIFQGVNESGQITFDFAGKPLKGYSKSQRLDFEAAKAEGELRRISGGGLYIQKGTLSGSVKIWLEKGQKSQSLLTSEVIRVEELANRDRLVLTFPGAVTFAGQDDQNLRAGSGTFVFVGKPNQPKGFAGGELKGGVKGSVKTFGGKTNAINTIDTGALQLIPAEATFDFVFPSAFTFGQVATISGPNGSETRTITFSGTKGEFKIPNETTGTVRPIRSATVEGRVKITIKSVAPGQDEPLEITAEGDRLTMDEAGEMRLVGNIRLESDTLSYRRTGSSEVLYIQFNDLMEVVKYGSKGNPSKVEIEKKEDGG